MAILGWICLVVAIIWVGYKAYVSYNSAGGTTMATVYDAAMYPPLLGAIGLFLVLPTFDIQWSIWIYVGVAFALAVVAGIVIKVAEILGDKPL